MSAEEVSCDSDAFVSILKGYKILLQKSSKPHKKKQKEKALEEFTKALWRNLGGEFEESKVMKKILNMKSKVKNKSDLKRTWNRPIKLLKWEQQFLDILQSDSNPSFSYISGAVSAGLGSEDDEEYGLANSSYSLQEDRGNVTEKAKKPWKRSLPCETEETKGMSNAELHRCVLLEQLRYCRLKMEKLLQNNPELQDSEFPNDYVFE